MERRNQGIGCALDIAYWGGLALVVAITTAAFPGGLNIVVGVIALLIYMPNAAKLCRKIEADLNSRS